VYHSKGNIDDRKIVITKIIYGGIFMKVRIVGSFRITTSFSGTGLYGAPFIEGMKNSFRQFSCARNRWGPGLADQIPKLKIS
jgi:hypothetical protein